MAARIRRIEQTEKTKEKIRSTQLIKRLTEHALGDIEMQSSQVTAALGLIKKVLPDLAAVQQEVSGPDGNPIETTWKVEVIDATPKDS